MRQWYKSFQIEVFTEPGSPWCWHVLKRGVVLGHGINCLTHDAALEAAKRWIDEEVSH